MADLRLTFEGGTRTLLGFALAFAVIIAVFVPLNEFTQGISQEVWYLQEVVLFGIIAGVTLVLLHVDGVSLRDIGFSRRFVLPALLHGFGNTWPLLIDWTGWSEIPLVIFFAAVAFFYVGVTVVYWSWATETRLTPRLRRFDDQSSFFS